MSTKQSVANRGPGSARAVFWLCVALSLSVLCAWANWYLFHSLGFLAPKLWLGLLRSIIFIDLFQITAFVAAIMALRLVLERLPIRTVTWLVTGTAIVVFGLSIATLPTRSQDFYHDAMLVQHYVDTGSNPYLITPVEVGGSWLPYLLNWLDVSYIYGPLFALVLAAILATHQSLLWAVISMKLLTVLAVGLTMWCMWQIMKKRSMNQRIMALALFCLNPLTIQTGIVDVHNDVFIGLGITASYYFFAKKQHAWSYWMLFLAGLGKFVSVVLMPLPILGIVYSHTLSRTPKTVHLLFLGAGSLGIAALLFAPFGIKEALNGISVMTSFRLPSYESVGSLLLMDGLGLSVLTVRLLGVTLAVGLSMFLFRREPSPRQFTIPIAVFLLMGFAILQPWYLLWILPLLCVSERYWVVIALSVPFSLLSPNINFSVSKATAIFMLLIIGGILCKNIANGQQKSINKNSREPHTS